MRPSIARGQAGFTLIEILVVVVILGILASIIVPKIMKRPEEARRTLRVASGIGRQFPVKVLEYILDKGPES